MTPVVIESPYAGDLVTNKEYLKRALLDSLERGEAPFASHELYTRVLLDAVPEQRELGMRAGLRWGCLARLCAVYMDYGVSDGMARGIENASRANVPIEFRRIGLLDSLQSPS